MALRLSPQRICASFRTPRVNGVSIRFASAAAAALKGSSLPQDVKDSIAVSLLPSMLQVQLLILYSVNHPCQHQIHPQPRRQRDWSINNYRTWCQPMSAHHPCSRKERGASCGTSRIENIWILPRESLSMRLVTATQALRAFLPSRYALWSSELNTITTDNQSVQTAHAYVKSLS